jgi:hypothetical protein
MFKTLAGRLGSQWPAALAAGTLVACGALFFLFNRQPQGKVFAELAKPPASVTEARLFAGRFG